MTQQLDNAIRRRTDGSIDLDFYARRAVRLRNTAKVEAMERLSGAFHEALQRAARDIVARLRLI